MEKVYNPSKNFYREALYFAPVLIRRTAGPERRSFFAPLVRAGLTDANLNDLSL